jgi:hypothetical protein
VITLDHLSQIVYSSGSRPPVADTCVIENHVAARDEAHQRFVGSELVITLILYAMAALFLLWGLPVRAWSVAADALQPPLRCGFQARLTASVRHS